MHLLCPVRGEDAAADDNAVETEVLLVALLVAGAVLLAEVRAVVDVTSVVLVLLAVDAVALPYKKPRLLRGGQRVPFGRALPVPALGVLVRLGRDLLGPGTSGAWHAEGWAVVGWSDLFRETIVWWGGP